MSTRPDDESAKDRTILPSADTPDPEYEPGDLVANPRAITPRPGGSRVNPHGIRRSPGSASVPSAESVSVGGDYRPTQDRRPPALHSWQQPVPGPPADNHRREYRPGQRQPTPTIGIYGAVFVLVAVIVAFSAPFVPFLTMETSVVLWGATTGSANSYVILGAAAGGFVGGVLMMLSMTKPKCGLVGGIISMVAGAVIGGMAAYLLMNSDHRALIAQGGSFGVAAWLLIAAMGGLLIGGILGVVRGATTT